MECEAKIIMLVICFEKLNIEWGQIDPKGKRRVNKNGRKVCQTIQHQFHTRDLKLTSNFFFMLWKKM